MDDAERLRQRLAAAGAEIPSEIVDLVVIAAGPLVTALDDLVTLDLADVEPFTPGLLVPPAA
jgi:hypothetical protein